MKKFDLKCDGDSLMGDVSIPNRLVRHCHDLERHGTRCVGKLVVLYKLVV